MKDGKICCLPRDSHSLPPIASPTRITSHESRITSHGLSSVVSPALAGLPLAGALALKAICGGAEYIGNVLISRQEFEVLRSDGWEQVERNIDWRLGIIHESPLDGVILPELPVGRNQAQRFFGQGGHGRKALDLAIRE